MLGTLCFFLRMHLTIQLTCAKAMESSGPAPATSSVCASAADTTADTTSDVHLDVGASIKSAVPVALWLEARHSHMAQTWYTY
jgi:hypothetical protein